MKISPLTIALLTFACAGPALAQEELTGDTRLACEALLCLPSDVRPNECTPSLNRYFGIVRKKPADTARARQAFLALCPVSSAPSDAQRRMAWLSQ